MADPPAALTHGRHCSCSACAREDWTKIAAPCGMHGASCPAVYAPIAASLREEAMRRVDRRYDHTLDECKVPDIHRAEYAEEEKSLREVEGPSAAIEVVPHTHTRTIPRYYNHAAHEWMDKRTFEEADADFPYMARSGSVCAIGRTREGAVSMVETIMEARRV